MKKFMIMCALALLLMGCQNKEDEVMVFETFEDEVKYYLDQQIESIGDFENTNILEQLEAIYNDSDYEIIFIYYGNEAMDFYLYPESPLPDFYVYQERPVYLETAHTTEHRLNSFQDAATLREVLSISKAIYQNDDFIGVFSVDILRPQEEPVE